MDSPPNEAHQAHAVKPVLTDGFCVGVLTLGLLVRLGLIFFLHTSGLGETVFRQLDAESYDRIAWGIASGWRGGPHFDILAATEHIQVGYYYVVAILYLLFGHAPVVAQIFNAVLGVATAYLVYRMTLRYADRAGARVALVLACFFPSVLFWSSQNLKDPLVTFLLCGILLAVLRFSERGSPWALGMVLLAAAALTTLRTYLFFLLAASLAISCLWGDTGPRRRPARNWGMALAVVLCSGAVFFFYRSFGSLTWNYLASPSLENLQRIRQSTTGGGSSFLGGVDVSSLHRALAFVPIGFAYALLTPWPFVGGSVLYRMAIPEMILWYLVLPVAIWGGIGLLQNRRRGAFLLVLFATTTLATLGLFQSNMGTLLRQRAPAALLIFVLAGAGVTAAAHAGHPIQPALKRALDLAGASMGLLLSGPIMGCIALAIRVTSGAPVLYTQDRLGEHGMPFLLLKFRTMRPGPDPGGTEYSAEDDPRITLIGRWLRRYSLDELPQLWNILRGDMSLVGPRPMRPALYGKWNPLVDKRLKVRPGLTGWQQVNGRNSLVWEQIVALDAWYVDNATFWLDLRILWRTIWIVLKGEGLYFQGQAQAAPQHPGEPE